ncbi:MAG: hypothetical protein UV73_C0008G0019 [Candidatus Gottesmanbacteria bacterium GW2011_GWA2_43_14]|uniref:Uncharacterized protein n=1 Tax=Candidatus Gottesmanbacteria bacterium GW2011_GWA2_43_14 TaxID=1618443 RepID=A0A0G1DIH9_9BACT|nr:MAG: hypothetical protein UV73_C0008G0019 [Candidatus Gottesmanbacteria bacterium GW2011_GWA2_43_14]
MNHERPFYLVANDRYFEYSREGSIKSIPWAVTQVLAETVKRVTEPSLFDDNSWNKRVLGGLSLPLMIPTAFLSSTILALITKYEIKQMKIADSELKQDEQIEWRKY